MTLAEFLAARLDEDERIARDARPGYFTPEVLGVFSAIGDARHVICHDPARVLREVEAGRKILARYEDCLARMEDPDYPAGVARDQAREYEDFVLPNLAAAWSDHEDCDEDWTPLAPQ